MSDNRLLGLVLVFAPLSALSFGGGQAIIADMQHQTVAQGWLSDTEFADLFAISRAAPGPSTLISALIGWQVAGLVGALVATLAMYVPSSLIVYAASRWWHARRDSPWRDILERGLAPIAVGLVFAGVLAVLEAAHANIFQILTAAASAGLLMFTRISAYALMAAVAVVYAAASLM